MRLFGFNASLSLDKENLSAFGFDSLRQPSVATFDSSWFPSRTNPRQSAPNRAIEKGLLPSNSFNATLKFSVLFSLVQPRSGSFRLAFFPSTWILSRHDSVICGRWFSDSPKFSASLGLSRAKAFGTQPPIASGPASRQPPRASDRLRRILQSIGAIRRYPD